MLSAARGITSAATAALAPFGTANSSDGCLTARNRFRVGTSNNSNNGNNITDRNRGPRPHGLSSQLRGRPVRRGRDQRRPLPRQVRVRHAVHGDGRRGLFIAVGGRVLRLLQGREERRRRARAAPVRRPTVPRWAAQESPWVHRPCPSHSM